MYFVDAHKTRNKLNYLILYTILSVIFNSKKKMEHNMAKPIHKGIRRNDHNNQNFHAFIVLIVTNSVI